MSESLDSICSDCGNSFWMGINGYTTNEGDKCDKCAGIVRQKNGDAYHSDAPYELIRPIANIGQGGARVRPGDVVQVHPNRKLDKKGK